ncbi:MAG: flavin reductase family protein [Devosia sp.]|nr:flavin reductase family protein [Devosia sp.]
MEEALEHLDSDAGISVAPGEPGHAAGPAASDAFRLAMRNLASGVSVVTTGRGETRTGFTAISTASLSVDPPSLLVCVERRSSSWPVLATLRSFCVNVLAEDQAAIADSFAGRGGRKGTARYHGASWQQTALGSWALVGAVIGFDCVLEEAIERHTHAILIGAVRAIIPGSADARPLLHWQSAYRQLAE